MRRTAPSSRRKRRAAKRKAPLPLRVRLSVARGALLSAVKILKHIHDLIGDQS